MHQKHPAALPLFAECISTLSNDIQEKWKWDFCAIFVDSAAVYKLGHGIEWEEKLN